MACSCRRLSGRIPVFCGASMPNRRGFCTGAPLFQRLLALLVRPEAELSEAVRELRQQAPAATPPEASSELLTLIPTILLARFTDRPLQEICAMAGLTIEDFTQSVAYREIFGQGRQEGRQEGRRDEAAAVTLRLLNRRCGPLSEATTAQIQALPVEQLEGLADAPARLPGPGRAGGLAGHQYLSHQALSPNAPMGSAAKFSWGYSSVIKGASEHDDACQRQFT